MDTKKWPIIAQILIALGVIGSLRSIVGGLSQSDTLGVISGIVGLLIYWNVYKIKSWALIGLSILLSLNILLSLINIFKGESLPISLIVVGFSALVLIYFNSAKIKTLFG